MISLAIGVTFSCLEKLIAVLHICMESLNSALLHTFAINGSKVNCDDGPASGIQFYRDISLKWQPRSTNLFPSTSRQPQSPEWAKNPHLFPAIILPKFLMGTNIIYNNNNKKVLKNDLQKGSRVNQRYC